MITFKNLEIQSFKSIFNCTLDFEKLQGSLYSLEGKNHTVNFAASNGSGKSTLMDALAYVLYGSTNNSSIKKADYQNKNTNVKLRLKLSLNIQGTDYIIERTDKDFKLYKDGEDISELTKTDTEKKFQDILNLTKAEFFNFTYLTQLSSGSFLSKTPSEKLNCIKDFIFGEELLSMQSKIDNLLKETKQELKDIEMNVSSLSGTLNALNSMYKHKEDKKETFEFSLDEYKQQLSNIKQQDNEKRKLQNQLNANNNNIVNLKQKLKKVKEQFEIAKENKCPTCGQHLQDDTVLNKLRAEAKTIKQTADNYNEEIRLINQELDKYTSVDSFDEMNRINKIIAKYEEQDKNNRNYDEIFSEIEQRTKQKKELEDKLQYVEFKQKQVQQLQKYFKTDFISHIQQAFLNEIENYLNIYCRDVFEADFKLLFSNNSLELLVGDKPYNYYSGGEAQRIDMLFVFAIKIALMSFTDKCTNLFIADETLSGQDSQAFEGCIELISNLTSAEELTTILVSHRDINYQNNRIVIERFENKTELRIETV